MYKSPDVSMKMKSITYVKQSAIYNTLGNDNIHLKEKITKNDQFSAEENLHWNPCMRHASQAIDGQAAWMWYNTANQMQTHSLQKGKATYLKKGRQARHLWKMDDPYREDEITSKKLQKDCSHQHSWFDWKPEKIYKIIQR